MDNETLTKTREKIAWSLTMHDSILIIYHKHPGALESLDAYLVLHNIPISHSTPELHSLLRNLIIMHFVDTCNIA